MKKSAVVEEMVAKISNISGLRALGFACICQSTNECHNHSNRSFYAL